MQFARLTRFALPVLGASLVTSFGFGQLVGPSTSTVPYVLPSAAGVKTISILSVGDFVNLKPDGTPYYLVGIPDGMGAWNNGSGTFNLLVNHELVGNAGAVRAHGSTGAFVSMWKIHGKTLRVIKGEDLIQNTVLYSGSSAFSRFCSGDLPGFRAFYDNASGLGTKSTIYMNGEESGNEGRAFAHIVNGSQGGTSHEVPGLGKFAWENAVAHPSSGRKTIVIGLDDSTPGQVYVYVGQRTNFCDDVTRAGLTGGSLYGIKVPGVATESRPSGLFGETTFGLHGFGDVSAQTGAWLQTESQSNAVTEFLRPEDGSWDPNNPNHFYFVTTDTFTGGRSRLYRLRFVDFMHPELGGTIDMLLDGTEGQKMMDNITVDTRGNVIIQEDPGGNDYLAKIWKYNISVDSLTEVAVHNPALFTPGMPGFLTNNEEASGVIEAPFLGEGWYLINVQAHYSTSGELVEGGQLLAMYIP